MFHIFFLRVCYVLFSNLKLIYSNIKHKLYRNKINFNQTCSFQFLLHVLQLLVTLVAFYEALVNAIISESDLLKMLLGKGTQDLCQCNRCMGKCLAAHTDDKEREKKIYF